MAKKLEGKTAVVTGASSGIGKAIAYAFAGEGANVAINYNRDHEDAERLQNMIREKGGSAMIVQADVSKEDQVMQLFDKVCSRFSGLDILVCNAGIQKDSSFADMTLQEWQKVIDVNLTGYFLCAREAARMFLKYNHTGQKKCAGSMIFVSSVHDVIPWAGHVNYAASKGGVSMLMKSLALEVAPNRIRVNAISPGAIKTDINKDTWSDKESERNLLKLIPYGRIGEPEDVSCVAVWLAGNESDYVTGTTIYVDGGMTLYPGFANNG